ncbi:MAG: DUF3575 domain-containing protein [Bacteroidia bacterium]|nr:DUF3575 domain-containing protein [Bacteroidia bacterium]
MKKNLLLIALAFIFTNVKILHAQEVGNAQPNPTKQESRTSKNVVKLNLFALGTANVSLQYERALHKNLSFALQGGMIPTLGMPGIIKSSIPSGIGNIKFSGYNVSPEFRIYPGVKHDNQAPHGFYFGLYMRHASYTAATTFEYKDSTNYPPVVDYKNIDTKLTYSGIGGGLMLGAQWIIKNRVSIDWWIIGFHGGVSKVRLTVDGSAISNDLSDLSEQIDDMDMRFNKVVNTSGSKVIMDVKGVPYLGLRTGLCIGVAF